MIKEKGIKANFSATIRLMISTPETIICQLYF